MKIESDKIISVLKEKRAMHNMKSFLFGASKRDQITIKNIDDFIAIINKMSLEEEQKARNMGTFQYDIDLYDEMEIYHDCTVQVLHNTVTDDYSIGYWRNGG